MPAKAKPLDNYHRMRAVGCLEESFLVEAGAGTGKTTLLMERLRNVICDRGVPMESIVAITFTEKAAAELKSRLREELEHWELQADGVKRERLRRIHDSCLDPSDFPSSIELGDTDWSRVLRGWRQPERGAGMGYRFSGRMASCRLRNLEGAGTSTCWWAHSSRGRETRPG